MCVKGRKSVRIFSVVILGEDSGKNDDINVINLSNDATDEDQGINSSNRQVKILGKVLKKILRQ